MSKASIENDGLEAEGHGQRMIHPLPCLFTTASLLSGFYAIISAINGNFFNAAVAIIVAGIAGLSLGPGAVWPLWLAGRFSIRSHNCSEAGAF